MHDKKANMLSTRGAALAALAAVVLAGCTKNDTGFLPPPSPSGVTHKPPAHTLYVAQEGTGNFPTGEILLFDASQVGGQAYGYIGGGSTHLGGPWDVTTDAAGDIWAANFDGLSSGSGASVTEYAPGAQGDATARTFIIGSKTTLNSPSGVRIEADGTIVVTDFQTNQIDFFAKGSNGNVAPKAIIGGANTTLNLPYGLAIDANGNIWVANKGAGDLVEFPPTASGNVAPINTLTGAGFTPRGIWIDGSGNFWVMDSGGPSIQEYQGPAPTGSQSPILDDTGTGLADARGSIVVDASSNVFASDTGTGIVGFYPGLALQSGSVSVPFYSYFGPMQFPRKMWLR